MNQMADSSCCPACSALIPGTDWATHQRRFHIERSDFACSGCAFKSLTFSDALAHTFLEGHKLPQTSSAEIKDLLASIPTKKEPLDSSGSANIKLESGELSESAASELLEISDLSEVNFDFDKCQLGTSSPLKIESKSPFRCIELPCSKCSAILRTQMRYRSQVAVGHARSCQGVRPFACSSCGYSSAKKGTIKRNHMKNQCKTADILTTDDCKAATARAMGACFPTLPFDTKGTEKRYAIECSKCGAAIRFSRRENRYGAAKQHAVFCWSIRSFACSECDYVTCTKQQVAGHIQSANSKCRGGEVVVVDKERNKVALQKGIRACFPNVQWKM